MTPPIKHSYWVEPGKLLAGEYPRNKDGSSSQGKVDALLHAGVNVFIDLTEARDGLFAYENMIGAASHQRFPIRDLSVPKSPDQTGQILDAIDLAIGNGDLVYVHCWGGAGRTGTIIGCWLARHGLAGEAALIELGKRWRMCPKSAVRQSPETDEQRRYVLTWAAGT